MTFHVYCFNGAINHSLRSGSSILSSLRNSIRKHYKTITRKGTKHESLIIPSIKTHWTNSSQNFTTTASTTESIKPNPITDDFYDDPFMRRRDLESYRRAFDRIIIPDSLERVINQQMTVQLSGAEAIYRMLAVRGVKQVFGYSGGAVLPLVDQFHRQCRSSVPNSSYNQQRSIEFINTAHEQAAAHAAQAVGRVSGRPGILVVTSGPGLTNCITGMQDALMDGDPMLVLSGQVKRK